MPKISSCTETIRHEEISINITFDVMYNSEYKFYSVIPDEYQGAFDLLTDSEIKELNGRLWSKTRYSEKKGAVCGETEAACIKSFTDMVKRLMSSAIQKRDVIIVYYTGSNLDRKRNGYNDRFYNPQNDTVETKFSYVLCTETTAGDKKKYAIYGERESPFERGKIEKVVIEIHHHHKTHVIIDDTPANREFLMRIYDGLETLNRKLKEFTSTEESLIGLISSGQKLIN